MRATKTTKATMVVWAAILGMVIIAAPQSAGADCKRAAAKDFAEADHIRDQLAAIH